MRFAGPQPFPEDLHACPEDRKILINPFVSYIYSMIGYAYLIIIPLCVHVMIFSLILCNYCSELLSLKIDEQPYTAM